MKLREKIGIWFLNGIIEGLETKIRILVNKTQNLDSTGNVELETNERFEIK